MSYTFTIGSQTFANLAGGATGRYALNISVSSKIYDIRRFHPPGVDGNYIIRLGQTGGQIVVAMKYVGDMSTILGYLKADQAAWENTAVTIVDDSGQSYDRCNLIPGSFTRGTIKGVKSGSLSASMFDAAAAFTMD